MHPRLINDVIAPSTVFLSLGFGLVALCLLTCLIALVEAVVLTLLKWNIFSRSLLAAAITNLASSLVGGVLLIFLQHLPLTWVIIAFILSVAIEGAILIRIRPAAGRRVWLYALAANLASYLVLILPAYLYSLAD